MGRSVASLGLALVLLLAGCKRPAPDHGCSGEADCGGGGACASGECPPAVGASPPGSGARVATGSAAGPTCASVVAHLAEIVEREKAPGVTFDPAEGLAKCSAQSPTPAHLACLAAAKSVADSSACDKAAFAGVVVSTTVKRELDGLHLDQAEKPGARDGDYLVFRKTSGRKCGFLTREQGFAAAIFVMCGGGIISGPLTTKADIDKVSKELSSKQKKEHEVVLGIMNNWPYGGPTDVYDAKTGAYVGRRY